MSDKDLPSKDALFTAMALRGNSAEFLQNAIEEVNLLTKNGREIFPPIFPTWRKPEGGTALRTTPRSFFAGALEKDEAVAVKILLDEASALYQSFGQNDETARKISEVLDLPKGGWQTDATDGISDFGQLVGIAAGVRARLRGGFKASSKQRTWGDKIDTIWREKFEEPLRKDGLKIDENTVRAIITSVDESAEREITMLPEGARNPEEIQARIESRKRGARKAAELFVEAKSIASKIFGQVTAQP